MPKAADKHTTVKATRVADVPNLGPTIDRLRQLVAEAGDHLLLGDGPPHPDAKLLDLCAEAAHQRKIAAAAERRRWDSFKPKYMRDAEDDARYEAERQEEKRQRHKLSCLLRAAGKLSATTAAGIYAKAVAVRSSRHGAALLAMSLADDLIGNPALRAALWAAEPETASAPAGNVVPLAPRERSI